jgi:hypothetical protein
MNGGVYIGNTQQYFKHRMRGHIQDIKKLVERNLPSDSYAPHFAGLIPGAAIGPTPGMQ